MDGKIMGVKDMMEGIACGANDPYNVYRDVRHGESTGYKETMVRIALGVDFGHGESAGYYVVFRDAERRLIEKCEIEQLSVKNGEKKIFSTLTYKSDHVEIGDMSDVDVNAYFKRSPKEWDGIDPNSGKTYREMMKDFIGKLVECMLSEDHNPIMGMYRKEEIVLFVGCPSDKTWTAPESKAAYEELIREATGIPNVHVVAESTAAIFSIIRNNFSKNINPKDGVGVFDLGSSTADFTYVSLGKVLAEVSWTLGASAIEANIVEKALYEKSDSQKELGEKELDLDQVWNGDLTARQLWTRKNIKEAWYGDGTLEGISTKRPEGQVMTISYTPSDEYGNAQKRNIMGVEYPETAAKKILLNQAFMEDVIKVMPVCGVKSKGHLVETTNDPSWYELCCRFFIKCYNLLKNNKLSCKTIILTGGASRMDFIMDICKSVFKDEVEIYRDASPSYCVCKGLCQIAINKYRIDDVIEHEKKTVRSKADTALTTYKSDIQKKLTDYIFDSMIKVLKTLPDGSTTSEFEKKLSDYFSENMTEDTKKNLLVENLLNDANKKLDETVFKCVIEASERATEGFYTSGIDKDRFTIDMNMVALTISKINIDGTVIDTTGVTAHIGANIANGVGGICGIAGLLIFVFPLIGSLFLLLSVGSLSLGEKLTSKDNKIKNVAKQAEKFNKNKEKIKKKINDHKQTRDCIDKITEEMFGNKYSGYYEMVNNMVDKAVRIVALEHFEKTITG